MDKKFEAVIDLEAQPFTDAVRTAIAGLQALAAELEKANSSLNTMAGGADKSAAAADTVAGAAGGAADALNSEAAAAKAAAGAHDAHADAAKKNAAATAHAATENKKMRENMMMAASGMRMAASVASLAGNSGTSDALSVGGSVLNIFAMRAMMGQVGTVIATMEAGVNIFDKAKNWIDRDANKDRAERVGKVSAALAAETDIDRVQNAKSYADLLREQVAISKELRQVQQEISILNAGWSGSEADQAKMAFLESRKTSMWGSQFPAQIRLSELRSSENDKMLSDYDAIRKQALEDKGFELSLINAKTEEEKISVVETRIRQLQAESAAKEAAARAAAKEGGDPAEVKRLLDEATALNAQSASLEIQKAGMGKDKSGTSLPGQAYAAPDVDSLWKRGMFLGGSIGSAAPTGDYARRSATAAEKTAANTERLLAKFDQNTTTATWGG